MKKRGSVQIPSQSPEGDSFLTVTAGETERFDELLCTVCRVHAWRLFPAQRSVCVEPPLAFAQRLFCCCCFFGIFLMYVYTGAAASFFLAERLQSNQSSRDEKSPRKRGEKKHALTHGCREFNNASNPSTTADGFFQLSL